MTVLNTLNFVAFKPLMQTSPTLVRRRKLIAKLDEQIQLASDPSYSPKKHKWITDSEGNQRKVEVPKRVKRWWAQSIDGKINLVVRYGSKPIEFSKGKNAIELNGEDDVITVLTQIKDATENGELDAVLEKQAQFGRVLQSK
ncbi:hypothetical protein OE810_04560 [Rhodobacteraceae bacterium XHP0102]|nr:hypothetical protein [Rhodobacteraceae bacterium XHP0102]